MHLPLGSGLPLLLSFGRLHRVRHQSQTIVLVQVGPGLRRFWIGVWEALGQGPGGGPRCQCVRVRAPPPHACVSVDLVRSQFLSI